MVATLRYILPQQSKEHQMYRHEQYQHVWCYPHLVAILSMLTSAILLEELLVQSMKLNIYKQMILKTQLMLFDWRIQTTLNYKYILPAFSITVPDQLTIVYMANTIAPDGSIHQ